MSRDFGPASLLAGLMGNSPGGRGQLVHCGSRIVIKIVPAEITTSDWRPGHAGVPSTRGSERRAPWSWIRTAKEGSICQAASARPMLTIVMPRDSHALTQIYTQSLPRWAAMNSQTIRRDPPSVWALTGRLRGYPARRHGNGD
jgi:hypothetical protein